MEQINLNLIPNGILAVCHVSQYDNTGRKIRFHLFNGSDTYALSGTETITLRIRKTNGEILTFDISNTASDYIELTVLQQMSDVSGVSVCEFRLTDSGLDIGSFNFKMKVEPDAFDGNLSISEVSGPIATFETDLAEDLIKLDVDINPVQDLHGYDAPWIGGAGKNKCKPLDNPVTRSSGITVTPQADGSVILNGTQVGSSGTVITAECYIKQGVTYIASIGNYDTNIIDFGIQGFGHVKKVTHSSDFSSYGVQVYITEGTTLNNVRLYPQIEEGSTATDWTPYENICPITGWDEVNVAHSGINIWDEEWEVGQYNTTTGGKQSNSNRIRCKNLIPIKKNTTYQFVIKNISADVYIVRCFYDRDGVFISGTNTRNRSVIAPDNACYMTFSLDNNYGNVYNDNISINYPSTATEYEPYIGNTVTVQFGQTVYGGTINLTTGLLRITHSIVDLGSLNWVYATDAQRWRAINSGMKSYPSRSNDVLFDKYATDINAIAGSENKGYIAQLYIYVHSTDSTNAPTGNCVYPLATPIEIQLTAQQIEAFVGTNVIYADTGDVDVEYYTTLEGGND